MGLWKGNRLEGSDFIDEVGYISNLSIGCGKGKLKEEPRRGHCGRWMGEPGGRGSIVGNRTSI